MSEPRVVNLEALFTGRLFRVPDYQRGYAWTLRQLEDFWHDLEVLTPKDEHFMGMVVVKSRPTGGRAGQPEELELIDGQQRLTTVILVIDAVVDALENLPGEEAATLASNLRERYISSQGRDRLRLNADSREFFKEVLEKEMPAIDPENRSQQNLMDAATFFRQTVQTSLGEDGDSLDAFGALVHKLTHCLRFVLYPVVHDAEAGLIFEVMNNRGKPLSQADRVKNYLMYAAQKSGMHTESIENISAKWGLIFKAVMRSVPDGLKSNDVESRLLRTHWVLFKEAAPPREQRTWSISQRIREDMALPRRPDDLAEGTPSMALHSRIEAYTNSLSDSAHQYALIMHPTLDKGRNWNRSFEGAEELVDTLRSFSRMSHTASALPILLAGLNRLQAHPEQMLALAKALATFSFRVYAIARHRGNTGQSEFRRKAHRLYQAEPAARSKVAGQIIKELYGWSRYYGSDDKLREHLRSDRFYQSPSTQEIRYLFYEYERFRCGSQQLAYEWSAFSNGKETQIEHIWPQNPREERYLGRTPQNHQGHVHRLGNLTVTRFNAQLSNKLFADKKRLYRDSPVTIERCLADERTWSMKHVNERTEQLSEFVINRWPILDLEGETSSS